MALNVQNQEHEQLNSMACHRQAVSKFNTGVFATLALSAIWHDLGLSDTPAPAAALPPAPVDSDTEPKRRSCFVAQVGHCLCACVCCSTSGSSACSSLRNWPPAPPLTVQPDLGTLAKRPLQLIWSMLELGERASVELVSLSFSDHLYGADIRPCSLRR